MSGPRRWIRLDAEFEESAWIAALPGQARGCWPRLLCWVKLRGKKGRCRWPDEGVLARQWRVPVASVVALIEAGIEDEAIAREGDELVIVNWDEYQEPDKTASDRKRKQRERERRKVRHTPVTRDNPVTRHATPDPRQNYNNNHDALRAAEGVENSGSGGEPPPELDLGQLLEAARRECGLGLWNGREESSARSVLATWLREGKRPDQIDAAIHGVRMLSNAGKIDWLPPQRPFGLKALRNTFTLADQGDGRARRPLFDVAAETYQHQQATARGASTGPALLADILDSARRASA